MKRTVLHVCLLVSLVAAACQGTFTYTTGFESPEWVAGEAWTQNGCTGNSSYIINNPAKAYSGSQVLSLGYANGYSGNLYMPISDEPETGLLMVEFMVNHGDRLGFTQAGNTGLYIEGNDGYRSFGMIFDSITQNIMIQTSIDTGYDFQESTWYKVKIVMYQDNPSGIGTADFYLNDALIASNVNSLHSISRGIKRIHLYGGSHVGGWPANDHYSYYDDIAVTVPEPATLVLCLLGGIAALRRRG